MAGHLHRAGRGRPQAGGEVTGMNRLECLRERVDTLLLALPDAEERRCAYVHLYGVSQLCVLLALKRGLAVDTAAAAGMLHDLAAYTAMDAREHAGRSAAMAAPLLEGLFSSEETEQIVRAIARHSDKQALQEPPDELLKDADAFQHLIYDPAAQLSPHAAARCRAVARELGLMVREG